MYDLKTEKQVIKKIDLVLGLQNKLIQHFICYSVDLKNFKANIKAIDLFKNKSLLNSRHFSLSRPNYKLCGV